MCKKIFIHDVHLHAFVAPKVFSNLSRVAKNNVFSHNLNRNDILKL